MGSEEELAKGLLRGLAGEVRMFFPMPRRRAGETLSALGVICADARASRLQRGEEGARRCRGDW